MTVVVLTGGEQKLCRRGVTASHPAGASRSGPLAGRPGPPPPPAVLLLGDRTSHDASCREPRAYTRVCGRRGPRVPRPPAIPPA